MQSKPNEDMPSKEIMLHHLDRVLDAYQENIRLQNRTWFFLNIFSLISIALTFGIVSVRQDISIVGFTLSIPNWSILLIFSYVVCALFVALASMSGRSFMQMSIIKDLYCKLGYPEDQLLSADKRAGMFLSLFDMVIGNLWNISKKRERSGQFTSRIITILMIVLPIISVTSAIFKLTLVINNRGNVLEQLFLGIILVAAFIVPFILMIANLYNLINDQFK